MQDFSILLTFTRPFCICHIYDILKCQCPIIKCDIPGYNPTHCKDGAHITCVCPRSDKIPVIELRFIMDQSDKEGLLGGGMHMGQGVDVEEAKMQQKREEMVGWQIKRVRR